MMGKHAIEQHSATKVVWVNRSFSAASLVGTGWVLAPANQRGVA
jgi:hypothetical protein